MISKFQLERYQTESVAVVLNDRYDPGLKDHAGDIKVTVTVSAHEKDLKRHLVILEIQVSPTKGKQKAFFPYHIAIRGRGFFRFHKTHPKEEAKRILNLNGAAILYGMLRAQIGQTTAQAVHGSMLLPCFNFVEMYEQNRAEARKKSTPKTSRTALQKTPRKTKSTAKKRPKR